MAEVLILDDDAQYGSMLAEHIQRAGHGVSLAHTLGEGRSKAEAHSYDIVFLDIRLPDGSGLDLLPELRTRDRTPEVIIVTGFGDAESAELAIQYGAWDYVQKRSPIQTVMLSLDRALQYRETRSAMAPRVAFYSPELVGHSHSFRACLNVAAQAASTDVNVLLIGETGTGKEVLAKAIHDNSSRVAGPFIVVDCTALPENLIGSLLFGHERGAFTGADHKRIGLIQQADGGTLFLDEIGDMPLEIQKSFLRVLQEHRFRPLGASKEVASNFRLVAATHRNLDRRAEEGAFRRDLLFRLRSLTISLPPLRERMGDIDSLASHFLIRECTLRGGQVKGLTEGFREALRTYDWPGNVRELANAMAAAAARAGEDPVLFAAHLPVHIRLPLVRASAGAHSAAETAVADGPTPWPNTAATLLSFREMRNEFEKAYLAELVRRAEGDIEKACQLSGLSRPHIYSLLKKHAMRLR